jgi:hypothetical protein
MPFAEEFARDSPIEKAYAVPAIEEPVTLVGVRSQLKHPAAGALFEETERSTAQTRTAARRSILHRRKRKLARGEICMCHRKPHRKTDTGAVTSEDFNFKMGKSH